MVFVSSRLVNADDQFRDEMLTRDCFLVAVAWGLNEVDPPSSSRLSF